MLFAFVANASAGCGSTDATVSISVPMYPREAILAKNRGIEAIAEEVERNPG
jgi:hypothetical protein